MEVAGLFWTRTCAFAAQDGRGLERPIGPFARESLSVRDEASARARLERDPSLAAVLIDRGNAAGAGAPLEVLKRRVPDVTTAVVMAGGLGTRLRPLTDDLPKPLVEVGGRFLLARILDGLRANGVERVFVSVNHLRDKVKQAIGDGSTWGLDVSYLEEDEPLDTGAGLAMLGEADGPFYVMNGDIVTDVNLRSLGRLHQLGGHLATVATYLYPAPLPYGVVHSEGERVDLIEEKPILRYPVNAGIYAFSPAVLEHVEHGRPLAMVDLLNRLAAEGHDVGRFPLVEYWNDVGSPEDLERARSEASTG